MQRLRHFAHLRQMRHQFARCLMHAFDLRAGQLELAAGLERDRAAAGDVEQADDVRPLHDRLPAEQVLHAFEQRANAVAALVGHRPVALQREDEFLVLGADTELRFGFDALSKPIHEIVAPLDRRQVDLITRHAGSRRKSAATLYAAGVGGQCGAHDAFRRPPCAAAAGSGGRRCRPFSPYRSAACPA